MDAFCIRIKTSLGTIQIVIWVKTEYGRIQRIKEAAIYMKTHTDALMSEEGPEKDQGPIICNLLQA